MALQRFSRSRGWNQLTSGLGRAGWKPKQAARSSLAQTVGRPQRGGALQEIAAGAPCWSRSSVCAGEGRCRVPVSTGQKRPTPTPSHPPLSLAALQIYTYSPTILLRTCYIDFTPHCFGNLLCPSALLPFARNTAVRRTLAHSQPRRTASDLQRWLAFSAKPSLSSPPGRSCNLAHLQSPRIPSIFTHPHDRLSACR